MSKSLGRTADIKWWNRVQHHNHEGPKFSAFCSVAQSLSRWTIHCMVVVLFWHSEMETVAFVSRYRYFKLETCDSKSRLLSGLSARTYPRRW